MESNHKIGSNIKFKNIIEFFYSMNMLFDFVKIVFYNHLFQVDINKIYQNTSKITTSKLSCK
jgi:hypothetical protein